MNIYNIKYNRKTTFCKGFDVDFWINNKKIGSKTLLNLKYQAMCAIITIRCLRTAHAAAAASFYLKAAR